MVEFNCESCGASVKAPPSLAGKAGKCPKCGTLNRVPDSREVVTEIDSPQAVIAGPTSVREEKACPYCGETIKSVAILCRFCGIYLQTGTSSRSISEQAQGALAPVSVQYSPARDAFQGTLPLMVRLAVKAVHQVGFLVENANEGAGIVTFRTGGAVSLFGTNEVEGSLLIEESGEHWFRVSGSAKPRHSEINITWDPFGKANRKAEQIISMMKTMSR